MPKWAIRERKSDLCITSRILGRSADAWRAICWAVSASYRDGSTMHYTSNGTSNATSYSCWLLSRNVKYKETLLWDATDLVSQTIVLRQQGSKLGFTACKLCVAVGNKCVHLATTRLFHLIQHRIRDGLTDALCLARIVWYIPSPRGCRIVGRVGQEFRVRILHRFTSYTGCSRVPQ